MAALNPTGPSQPSQNTAYNTAGNPADKEPAEQATSQAQAKDDAPQVDQRVPSKQSTSIDEATPTSMARGVHGAGPGEDPSSLSDRDKGVSKDTEADALATYGEDEIADAVKSKSKSGAAGGEPGFESDLDRKKAEQAPAREKMKEEEGKKVDVAGVLGQTGGPANPVDKGGYPNSGS